MALPQNRQQGQNTSRLLSSHGLLTINEKDGPTYSGPTGESWTHITAATIDLAHKILNWRVSEENTLSDHKLILFSLKTRSNDMHSNRTTNHLTRKYATQVGNWDLFQQRVLQHRHQWGGTYKQRGNKETTRHSYKNNLGRTGGYM
jgi:hypothetical protein